MAFVPSDLDSVIWHWRGEDLPSDAPDPFHWDDVVEGHRVSVSGTIPTYNATAIGGLPGIDCSGAYLTSESTATLNNNTAVAVVCNRTDMTATGLFHVGPSATPSWSTSIMTLDPYTTSANYLYYYGGSYGTFKPSLPSGVDSVVAATLGLQCSGMWINGGRCRGGEATNDGQIVAVNSLDCYVHIGRGTTNFSGAISEVVVWEETGAGHLDYIVGFLAHKYGTTLPTWHRFYAAPPTSAPGSGGGVSGFPISRLVQ